VNKTLRIEAPSSMVPQEDIASLENISSEFLGIYEGELAFRNYVLEEEGCDEMLVEEPNATLSNEWKRRWDRRVKLQGQEHRPGDGPAWLMSLLDKIEKESTKFKSAFVLHWHWQSRFCWLANTHRRLL
jgi:hypothetical protein